MEKEFIPYKIALALKSIGFGEPCFGYYGIENELNIEISCNLDHNLTRRNFITAPLYQEAFKWLYQKLDIEKGLMPLDTESQQLLLKELIEKVSSKYLLA